MLDEMRAARSLASKSPMLLTSIAVAWSQRNEKARCGAKYTEQQRTHPPSQAAHAASTAATGARRSRRTRAAHGVGDAADCVAVAAGGVRCSRAAPQPPRCAVASCDIQRRAAAALCRESGCCKRARRYAAVAVAASAATAAAARARCGAGALAGSVRAARRRRAAAAAARASAFCCAAGAAGRAPHRAAVGRGDARRRSV